MGELNGTKLFMPAVVLLAAALPQISRAENAGGRCSWPSSFPARDAGKLPHGIWGRS